MSREGELLVLAVDMTMCNLANLEAAMRGGLLEVIDQHWSGAAFGHCGWLLCECAASAFRPSRSMIFTAASTTRSSRSSRDLSVIHTYR
jgi:hypothetical protein